MAVEEATLKQRIVTEAYRWIDTPYRHQASLHTVGADCLGLIRGVWREIYGSEPAPVPPYTPDWAEARGEETLLIAAQNYLEEIDKIIEIYLTNHSTLKNLPKLLFATLRIAMCELKYFPETPRKVVINEYTDIASNMLDNSEIGFVNSVLDKYASECR